MTFKIFVLKKGTKYLRFGSYGEATEVDSPLKATQYSRKRDAQYRRDDPSGRPFRKPAGWADIVEIEMELKGERDV